MKEANRLVVAAEKGGREVALPVLAGTLTTVVVFFPVTMLYGVSKFLFSALAIAVVISLFASYIVALTVVPLFCANFIKSAHGDVVHESAEDRACCRFFTDLSKATAYGLASTPALQLHLRRYCITTTNLSEGFLMLLKLP